MAADAVRQDRSDSKGFADEVFRVWANDHPEIEITAENMSKPVAFMIERARRR